MNLRIEPSRPAGRVAVPPSKSMAHRFLVCAALAEGESRIRNLEFSQDVEATCDCLRALGAEIRKDAEGVTVLGVGGRPRPSGELFCRESGSTLRFLLPLCLWGEPIHLTGSPRLMERPLSVYEEIFDARGVSLTRDGGGVTVCGRLTAGDYSLRGDVSSQFFTGLFFLLPLLEGESRLICTTELECGSYINLTLSALEAFGVKVIRESDKIFRIPGGQTYAPRALTVEGDESNAAFFGALAGLGYDVTLTGRNPQTLQGDRVWAEYFSALTAGDATLSVADCPDLAPILMTVASLCHGATLTHTRRLKIKESDRGAVMAEELAKFGADIRVDEDSIRIFPSTLYAPLLPLEGHNDHRVVMSLAVAAVKYGGELAGAEAVAKSYPSFFEVLQALNVKLVKL